MTFGTISERINQKPFRPFALETVGGTWIEVDRKEDVLLYQRKKPFRVVIFDQNGKMYIFEPEQISTIESYVTKEYLDARLTRLELRLLGWVIVIVGFFNAALFWAISNVIHSLKSP